MYLVFLSKYSMEISQNVTRFGQDLLEKAPNYEIVKDQETRACRKESVRELFSHQKAGLNPSGQLFIQLERTYLNGKTCLMVT